MDNKEDVKNFDSFDQIRLAVTFNLANYDNAINSDIMKKINYLKSATQFIKAGVTLKKNQSNDKTKKTEYVALSKSIDELIISGLDNISIDPEVHRAVIYLKNFGGSDDNFNIMVQSKINDLDTIKGKLIEISLNAGFVAYDLLLNDSGVLANGSSSRNHKKSP